MHFHHVQLLTARLTEQLEFYQNVLGLPVLGQSNASVIFQVGSSKLEFVQDSREAFYHFAFNIPSHQFIEAKAWLSERVELIWDSSGSDEFRSQNWNANQFYFYDSGGNIAELIARHDLKSETKEPFSAKSFELINELGVVTGNVPQTVKRIQDLGNMPLYRAVMDEQFVPVGDETGLFIVVKAGRIWFPETKAAVAAPFKVILSNGKGEVVTLDQNSLST